MKQFISIILLFLCGSAGQYAQAQAPAKTHIPNSYVAENVFIKKTPVVTLPPTYEQAQGKLPQPYWPARPDAIKSYNKAWQIAFGNLHPVTKENRFVSPFIDPAFNKHLFMWDACFMTLFGRYGSASFNFQQTLDNFYSRQQPDGFICRQLSEENGEDRFERFDPISTGPNIFPWAEWEYFLNFNDTARLKQVFSPMLAYYQWLQQWRTWPDGTYYSSGWGCGMDNQPRLQPGYDVHKSHGFMSWIDITLQEIYAGNLLVQIAGILGRSNDTNKITEEVNRLTAFTNKNLWDSHSNFYYDRYREGELSYLKTIGAYWALLAGIVPKENTQKFISHLADTTSFSRLHRPASWAASNPSYDQDGGYWRGAVWAPMAYMALRGLTKNGYDSLAYQIALNHFNQVTAVFNQTGTFFENYAPDKIQGNNRKDFVGWTALTPISVLFEYVFGLRPDVPAGMLVWDVRMTDEFGVKLYPYGKGLVSLSCKKRTKLTDEPQVQITSSVPVKAQVLWQGGSKWMVIKGTKS